VQVVNGLLGIGGGLDDAALVVFEDFEPVGNITDVVLTHFRRQLQIGAQKCAAQLGNQFLAGVALIAPMLPAEIAGQALGCLVE